MSRLHRARYARGEARDLVRLGCSRVQSIVRKVTAWCNVAPLADFAPRWAAERASIFGWAQWRRRQARFDPRRQAPAAGGTLSPNPSAASILHSRGAARSFTSLVTIRWSSRKAHALRVMSPLAWSVPTRPARGVCAGQEPCLSRWSKSA